MLLPANKTFNGTSLKLEICAEIFSLCWTQAPLCVKVFAYLCVCAYLVFVRGYEGTLAPGSQLGDEWLLLHHCLGQQWSQHSSAMSEGKDFARGGGEATGHVGVVLSTPGRGQGSSPSASIFLLRLSGLWI